MKKSTLFKTIVSVTLLVSIVLVFCTFNYAKYVVNRESGGNAISASNFFFTANYLSDVNDENVINSGNDLGAYVSSGGEVEDVANSSIALEVYNFDKNNTSLVSKNKVEFNLDIVYYNSIGSGYQEVTGESFSGQNLETQGDGANLYKKAVGAKCEYAVITAQSTKDYKKTLMGVIRFSTYNNTLDNYYTFTEQSSGEYKLTILAGKEEDITISWAEYLSPDNSNALMSSWTTSEKTLQLNPNKTYELTFFKKGSGSVTEQNVTTKIQGSTISLS